ncbi:MAG: sensor histidine kinase [Nannocystis sp.]|nr:histidine kinase [Nannocystis sp.]MBA3547233.1 sensor histidine kinase [Nannocystis sp.]
MSAAPDPLLRHTLLALTAPRRLIPIALVATPLVAAQHSLSRDPLAMPLGVLMCLVFALVAPYLWRRLAARDGVALGLLLYGLAGALVVAFLGVVVPRIAGVGATFMTGRESMLVSLALFWVGGWGLGRDIEFEAGLERERARAESMAREAERAQLLALRGQLDPHFLFNTLNAIAEWCRTDGEVAERAILQLSSMLRTILAGVPLAAWPLRRELELCRDLFALHLIRDPNLFSLLLEGEPGDLQVPPLLLLPLAENAVKHGPAAGHRGQIRLSITHTAENATIELENPGPYRGPRDGGEGLPTVHKRLALAYPGRARLELRATDHGTLATLTLPREHPVVRT